MSDELLSTSGAAKVLETSEGNVRRLVRVGELKPAVKATNGWALYRRRDVERLREKREEARAKRAA